MRRTELRPDPDKVRQFIQRNRKPLRRSPPKARVKLPPSTAKAVRRRCRGSCIVCKRSRGLWLQPHHVLPVEKWPQYETEPLNIVLICWADHDNHTRAHRRVRWDELPEETRTWIRTLGGRETLYAERTYRR